MPTAIGTIPHATPPLFAEQRAQMQQQAPVYSWASVEGITKAAAACAPPPSAAPAVPSTYEDAYTESSDPDMASLGGQMQYVYFEMPQTAMPGYPSSSTGGSETTPLMAAAPSAPSAPMDPSATTTTSGYAAGPGGFPSNMFANPCAYTDIPKDD